MVLCESSGKLFYVRLVVLIILLSGMFSVCGRFWLFSLGVVVRLV